MSATGMQAPGYLYYLFWLNYESKTPTYLRAFCQAFSPMASTVPEDGAEKCYYSDCTTLTTKKFRCILGHTVWMCNNCHRDRPVCPLELNNVGALCRAEEEEDYKTDTDLDGRPDSSEQSRDPLGNERETIERALQICQKACHDLP